jgi:hypothetical protein
MKVLVHFYLGLLFYLIYFQVYLPTIEGHVPVEILLLRRHWMKSEMPLTNYTTTKRFSRLLRLSRHCHFCVNTHSSTTYISFSFLVPQMVYAHLLQNASILRA